MKTRAAATAPAGCQPRRRNRGTKASAPGRKWAKTTTSKSLHRRLGDEPAEQQHGRGEQQGLRIGRGGMAAEMVGVPERELAMGKRRAEIAQGGIELVLGIPGHDGARSGARWQPRAPRPPGSGQRPISVWRCDQSGLGGGPSAPKWMSALLFSGASAYSRLPEGHPRPAEACRRVRSWAETCLASDRTPPIHPLLFLLWQRPALGTSALPQAQQDGETMAGACLPCRRLRERPILIVPHYSSRMKIP